MSKAISELKREHEAISFSLEILEKLASAARSGEEWQIRTVRRFVAVNSRKIAEPEVQRRALGKSTNR